MTNSVVTQDYKTQIVTEYKVSALEKLICECGGMMKVVAEDADSMVVLLSSNPLSFNSPTTYKHTCEICGAKEDHSVEYPRVTLVGADRVVRDIVQDELKKSQQAQAVAVGKMIEARSGRMANKKDEKS